MMDIAGFFKDNWTVIAEAPWAFLAAVAIGWSIGRFMYRQRIEDLNERIKKRDEDIERLKGQIGEAGADNENAERNHLLGQLIGRYITENVDVPEKVRLGLQAPPTQWINAELERLGQDWRVRTTDDKKRLKIYEAARWG